MVSLPTPEGGIGLDQIHRCVGARPSARRPLGEPWARAAIRITKPVPRYKFAGRKVVREWQSHTKSISFIVQPREHGERPNQRPKGNFNREGGGVYLG